MPSCHPSLVIEDHGLHVRSRNPTSWPATRTVQTRVGLTRLDTTEDDSQSEASEWELREREERVEERKGAGSRGLGTIAVQFFPTPSFLASADEAQGGFSRSLPLLFPWCALYFRDSPERRAEGAATSPAFSQSEVWWADILCDRRRLATQ